MSKKNVVNLYFSGNSMNNLLSYCGLTEAKMRASEKDLPVQNVEETCLWKIIISSANVLDVWMKFLTIGKHLYYVQNV